MNNKSDILVSVIVPAYNVDRYIEKCVNSLINQTLESLEIICVNDGSTDFTLQKLNTFAPLYPKVKIIDCKHSGPSSTRNSGIAAAKGKYVGFVDGDDWVDAKMYEGLAEALENNPNSEIAVCGVETIFMYKEDREKKKGFDRYFQLHKQGEHKIDQTTLSLDKSCCNKLYLKSFLDENQIRFPEGMTNEDEAFNYFILSRASHITYVNQRWYKYIRYGTGIMSGQEQDFQDAQQIPEYFTKVWPLLIEFIKRDFQYNILSDMIVGLLSKVRDFRGVASESTTSTLLHRLNYPLVADIIDSDPQSLTRQELQRLYDLNTIVDLPPINNSFLPKPKQPKERKQQPRFSLIIPVYNTAKYLYKCVESLRNQTFDNIEMIFINDGSTDESESILRRYAEIDKRIQVITQHNRGVFIARKVAAQQASGEYIMFVDPDDWINLKTCEYIDRFISSYNVDIVQYGIKIEHYGDFNIDYIKSVQDFLNKSGDIANGDNITMLRSCFTGDGIFWNNWGKAIRTDIVKSACAKMPEIKCNFAEDQIAMFYILSHSKSVKSIKAPLYHYRYGVGISTMQKENIDDFKVKLECFKLFKEAERFAKEYFEIQVQADVDDVLTAIHSNMMDNMWKRIIENANDNDKSEWCVLLCESAGIRNVFSFINKNTTPNQQPFVVEGGKYRKKYKKHLKAIRLLVISSVILLLANILLTILCFVY